MTNPAQRTRQAIVDDLERAIERTEEYSPAHQAAWAAVRDYLAALAVDGVVDLDADENSITITLAPIPDHLWPDKPMRVTGLVMVGIYLPDSSEFVHFDLRSEATSSGRDRGFRIQGHLRDMDMLLPMAVAVQRRSTESTQP